MELQTLAAAEVRQIHEALVFDFAQSKDPISPIGIRSEDLLESAVSRQLVGYDGVRKFPDPIDNAATLLYGICSNHPFFNGNKRTALVAMLVHLDKNKLTLFDTNQDDLYDLMINVAKHTIVLHFDKRSRTKEVLRYSSDQEVGAIAKWIRERASRLTRGEKLITFRELKRILHSHDYALENPHDNSIDIVRYEEVRVGLLFRRKVTTVRKRIGDMCWPGENQQVSIKEVKRVRKMCQLCEEDGVDSDSFYGSAVVIDAFVNRYRRILKRLAHA